MAAIVTDQFRILNANNFVETVDDSANSYYITLGLANPSLAVVFGRTTTWNTDTPNPTDNFNYIDHSGDTQIFGKKVTSANIRRLITRRDWTQGTRYEMYRHDYSVTNPSPLSPALDGSKSVNKGSSCDAFPVELIPEEPLSIQT